MGNNYILAINPGSTSTKVAIFLEEKMIFESKIFHEVEDILKFDRIIDQKKFRTKVVMNFFKENAFDPTLLIAVVGRDGGLAPMKSGTYKVNQEMVDFLENSFAEDVSTLGAMICDIIAKTIGIDAFIVAPVVNRQRDGIVLTGDLAYNNGFVELIKQRETFLVPVLVFHGEDEMSALAHGALKVLNNEEQAKNWKYKPNIDGGKL